MLTEISATDSDTRAPVQDARQHVAAQVVGAEPVLGARRLEPV